MSPSESPMAESPLPEDGRHFWRAALLLASIFSASACAIIYELLIGSTSAYFLGDSVQQFSVTIGLFLASFGRVSASSAGFAGSVGGGGGCTGTRVINLSRFVIPESEVNPRFDELH